MKTIAGICCILFLSGCIFRQNAYTEPADYDFSSASAPVSKTAVHFGVFGNYSGSDRRFLIRLKGERLQMDEYNRWLLIPEQLVKRRLLLLFPERCPSAREHGLTVDCMLYRFEFDLEQKRACFSAEYTLRDATRKQVFFHDFSVSFPHFSGVAGAEAMSRCMDLSAKRLGDEMKQFDSKE